MAIVKARCPNCNELIEIDDTQFNVVCKFCGVPFMPSEGIEKYNNYLATLTESLDIDTINVDAENISNYATLGIASLKEKNHEKCGFYAEDILKRKPNSPEGLLLKAFFVSNNYSKEDGIRNYLLAYENATDESLINLILDTFKQELEDYDLSNFEFLFKEITKHNNKHILEFYRYALNFISFSLEETSFIDNLDLNLNSVLDYLQINANPKFKYDNYNFYNNNSLLIIAKEEKIIKVIDLKYVEHDIERFLNKKSEIKYTYNFYLKERIASLKFTDIVTELEKIIFSYNLTIVPIKEGCYIATCVYGSYNSPEVWTLRRYRDEYLKSKLFGRIFIKIYYAISPTIVKLFHNCKWFHKINKKYLDKKVIKLLKKGYLNTPYRDIK